MFYIWKEQIDLGCHIRAAVILDKHVSFPLILYFVPSSQTIKRGAVKPPFFAAPQFAVVFILYFLHLSWVQIKGTFIIDVYISILSSLQPSSLVPMVSL